MRCQMRECEYKATHAIAWKTIAMAGTAFWYVCEHHVYVAADLKSGRALKVEVRDLNQPWPSPHLALCVGSSK